MDVLNIDGSQPGDALRIMRTPDAWPLGGLLALVRGNAPHQELGVLVMGATPPWTVFKTPIGIFDSRLDGVTDADSAPLDSETYPDPEGVLNAGWRVD